MIDALDEELTPALLPQFARLRAVARADVGHKLGKFGAFIGCSNYPECKFTRRLAIAGTEGGGDELAEGDKVLGQDPDTGGEVSVKRSLWPLCSARPAPALWLPSPKRNPLPRARRKRRKKAVKSDAPKPKRTSLPRGLNPNEVSLEIALQAARSAA